jgi:hypothetical protein
VLWIIDELHRRQIAPVKDILEALAGFFNDETVRLPKREIVARIRRYKALL